MPSIHDFTMSSITGEPIDLRRFENQVCLVVNVASE
jgi:glutathione peroxidase-family protein